MRRFLAILTMTIAVLGSMALRADAQTIGPYCFSTPPFTDQFVLFFTSNGANQFIGTGRDLVTASPLSSTMFLTGGTAVIGFIGMTPPTGGSHMFTGTANVNGTTGVGPGRCEAINTTGGCGTGTSISLSLISCPPGALSDRAPSSEAPLPEGHLMDGSR